MKKSTCFCFLFLAIGRYVFSQAPIRDDVQQIMDNIFSQVNTSKINTGYLYEKTCHITNMWKYNGVFDTTLRSDNWTSIYNETYYMAVNPSSLNAPDKVESTAMAYQKQDVNPIVLFFYDYNNIKSNAFYYLHKYV